MATFITRKRRMDGLGAWKTLAAFGIPAALMFVGVHGVMRWFNNVSGLAPFYGYFLALAPPLALMLAAAILVASRDGASPAWPALKERLRLRSMDRGTWLWTVGVLIAAFLLTGLMTALNGALVDAGWIPVPDWLPPFLAPLGAQMAGSGGAFSVYDAAFGGLRGNWGVFLLYLLLFFFNIAGEELWWRGAMLPRQEATLGGRAWLAHGLLWWAFHAFKWWDLLTILPVTLLISWLAQRTKNTTPAIVVHALFNGLGILPVLLGIMGVVG